MQAIHRQTFSSFYSQEENGQLCTGPDTGLLCGGWGGGGQEAGKGFFLMLNKQVHFNSKL